MSRILVAYASKHHSTQGIADHIAQTLQSAGHDVTLQSVDQVKNLTSYDAVVLGSAVFAGSWMKIAANFLKMNAEPLKNKAVWLFSSGPLGEGDPVELNKGWIFPEGLKPIADSIAPRDIALFSGKLNMNELGFGEKIVVRAVKPPMGDFRDWDSIAAWARSISEALLQPA